MTDSVKKILNERFGISEAEITQLAGYGNNNYRVSTASGKFVFKTYEDRPDLRGELEAESRILEKLAAGAPSAYPKPVADIDGGYSTVIREDGISKYFRLLTFVEGDILGPKGISGETAYSLGSFLGKMDGELSSLRSAPIEARRSKWDLQYHALNRPLIEYIENPQDRKYVEYFFQQASFFVDRELPFLRHGLIHGDANEWNIIARAGKVAAMIDFGDLCYSPIVNEVAIAAAYALMFAEDHITGASRLIAGYQEMNPLEEKEIALLFHLIALRLSVSVCNSALAAKTMPDNEYAFISEERAWRLIRKWAATNPLRIENEFRQAAGFEPRRTVSVGEDLAVRRKNTSRVMSLQFTEPIKMKSAAFQYMFDDGGRSYLDCYNNIPHVGHCHPRVVDAIAKASARLNTNTRYLTDEFNEYTTRLLSRFPERLDKIFLVNSGSAATDLALRLAAAHTGNRNVAVVEYGYHGNTSRGISVSHYKYGGKGGPGKSDAIIEAPIPDEYRAGPEAETGKRCAEILRERIDESKAGVSAFIAEPIVGCGGQVPLAQGFLQAVYDLVRKRGGVCISDETQTGFGRLGKWFSGYEMHGVEPDIVILGKPIGNGHPMAAVVTTSAIAESFETGMEFFSSFGGNTVSCAAGNAVLDVMDEEHLQDNARDVGGYLLCGLEQVTEEFESCGNARGEGLFLGLELVRSKDGKEPDGGLASSVQNALRDAGILVGTDGPHENVIKIKPPMCFTEENADELLGALRQALKKHERRTETK